MALRLRVPPWEIETWPYSEFLKLEAYLTGHDEGLAIRAELEAQKRKLLNQ